ncbi:amino acid adenylation domain-containing protein [Streptomyces sp. NPDC048392]|uniref:amino acid adenylation domain-containing protein n=1 Tax=Streptomyces sp. NPDC048392 TaxID=3365543 RepID=UPI00371A9B62
MTATTDVTARQRQLRGEVRALLAAPDAQEELAALGAGAAPGAPEAHPWRLYRRLGAGGLVAPHWPVRYGGRGLGWTEAGIVAEELALHGVPDTAIVNGVYNFGQAVRAVGTPAQRQRWLPAVASGRLVATALLTEPDAGSDLAGLRTKAVRTVDGWELSGTKIWNAKVHLAEVAICVARTGPGDGYAGISLFLVPLRGPGVRSTALDTTNVETLYEVVFDGLVVGDDHLLGAVGEGWPLLVDVLTLERAGLGYHGRARRWLTALTEHVHRLDGPAGPEAARELPALWRRLKAGRELAWQAVRELDAAGTDAAAVPAAVAKWFNTELASDIVELAHTADGDLAGGASASMLVPAHREAVGLTLAAGTSEMMLQITQTALRTRLSGSAELREVSHGAGTQRDLWAAHASGDEGRAPIDLGRAVLAGLGCEGTATGAGEVLIAASEHGHGTPLLPGPLKTRPRRDGGWSLSGTRWAQARGTGTGPLELLLPVALDGAGPTVVVVPDDRAGVAVEPLGAEGAPMPCLVHLHDVDVDPADLPSAADSLPYSVAVARARLLAAGHLLGGCRRMLRSAWERAESRHQFGRPLAANQSVGHSVAAAWARTQGAWALAQRVAADFDTGAGAPEADRADGATAIEDAAREATEVHALACDITADVTRLTTRVCGASGLLRAGLVQDFARLAKYPAAALGARAAVRAEAAIDVRPPRDEAGIPRLSRQDGPPSTTLITDIRLFEEQAAQTPDAVALVCPTERVTYQELNSQANRIARVLRRWDVGPDIPVAVCLERSVGLVAAVLGVLKAGGAYVPLDTAYPPQRLAGVIEDSDPAVVVTEDWMREWIPADRPLLCLDTDASLADEPDTDLPEKPHLDDLMYIMYTSGSTGRPKGVMVPHRGIANRMAWDRTRFPLTAADAVLQLTSISFDPSVWELFAALTSGARLVILPPRAHLDPRAVLDTVARERVTALTLTPAQLALLTEQEAGLQDCSSLRYVFCGGDVLPPPLAARFTGQKPELFNMYGPTEISIDATAWRYSPATPQAGDRVPIGSPISGVSAWVRDGERRETPDGDVGDLWISGAGLARGYLGRPAETADAFRPAPAGAPPGSRVYRTGDRARRNPDGTLEFHGRTDRQVKVRGHRVEPAEVEAALLDLPEVQRAVVLVVSGRLVAFVVAPGTVADTLRRSLQRRVPDHLVPTRWLPVDDIPYGPSGKVDHFLLRQQAAAQEEAQLTGSLDTRPQADMEAAFTRLVAEVLGLGHVDLDEEFFALGGDSLSAALLVTRAARRLKLELTIDNLLDGLPLRDLLATARKEGDGR